MRLIVSWDSEGPRTMKLWLIWRRSSCPYGTVSPPIVSALPFLLSGTLRVFITHSYLLDNFEKQYVLDGLLE
jgi:hypothetical protein